MFLETGSYTIQATVRTVICSQNTRIYIKLDHFVPYILLCQLFNIIQLFATFNKEAFEDKNWNIEEIKPFNLFDLFIFVQKLVTT